MEIFDFSSLKNNWSIVQILKNLLQISIFLFCDNILFKKLKAPNEISVNMHVKRYSQFTATRVKISSYFSLHITKAWNYTLKLYS